MDKQRRNRKGKPNYWVVITIENEEIRTNLKKVQEYLKSKYKSARQELNKALVDLDTNALHITLFGLHVNMQRLNQIRASLILLGEEFAESGKDMSVEIELKGLGAWNTVRHNIILYADLAEESATKVKNLAKTLRDSVMRYMKSMDYDENFVEPEEEEEEEEDMEEGIDEEDDEFFAPSEDDLPGFWIDDPRADIYVPHVTLMNSDPKWDKSLRFLLNPKGTTERIEDFGRSFNLMRDVRNHYSKYSFGTQVVNFVELQGKFQCVEKLYLCPQHDNNNNNAQPASTQTQTSPSKNVQKSQSAQPLEKTLIIMRGVSGSGKSTLAHELLAAHGNQGVILSTDDFFFDAETGEYHYNTPALPKAHYWNQLRAKIAMEEHKSPIIIDNTNLQPWEAQPYVALAREFNYEVQIREPETPWKADPVELAKRNSHGLKEEEIRLMLGKLDDYTVNDALKSSPPSTYNLNPKDKKKVEHSLLSKQQEQSQPEVVQVQGGKGAMRVEVTKNTGTKPIMKPLIVKTSDFETVKKQACNQLKLKYTKNTRVFTLRGEEIFRVDQMHNEMQLVISDDGADYVPIALKKTAAERRAEKMQQAQAQISSIIQQNQATKPAKMGLRGLDKIPLGISTILKDFLFLGSGRDAHTTAELEKHQITHILNVAKEFPSSTFAHIQYKEVEAEDVPLELLEKFYDPVFEFLEETRQKEGRVLIHCAVGKSRSPAFVIAYLMKHHGMNLKSAYELVRSAREIRINSGFIRQLMRLEKSIYGTSTLHWDDVETLCTSVEEWLKANDQPLKYPASHLWWEVLTKQKYHIPPYKLDELHSEMAKGLVIRKEPMKVVELRDNSSLYKMHLDIDVKTSESSWHDMEVLEFFIKDVQEIVKRKLDPKANADFVCTGVSGRFFHSREPDVKYKYGYHFIWPNALVTDSQQRDIVATLLAHFKKLDQSTLAPDSLRILQEIQKYNEWEEVIDTAILESESFRMLYSLKSFSCRMCEKKENTKKKSKSKSKKSQVEDQVCPDCLDTGMLDTRVHKFLGCFFANGEIDQDKSQEFLKDESLSTIRKRIEICSIIVPTEQNDEEESTQDTELNQNENTSDNNNNNNASQTTSDKDAGKYFYVAVMLDMEDQIKILKLFEPPPGWVEVATHMTVSLDPLPANFPFPLGERIPLKITAVGRTSSSLAVRVETEVPVVSKVPHITIAHSAFATAKDSNDIEEWKPLDKPVNVWGTLKEWHRYGPGKKETDQVPSTIPKVVVVPKKNKKRDELEVTKFLRKHSDEEHLTRNLNLKAVRHKEHLNLVQFSYSQLSCDMSNPIVQECRGIILDAKNNWRVVAFPYTKFFNYGETLAAPLDWSTAVVTEKIDGSMAVLYWYHDAWHVSSSSNPDGSAAITKGMTFAQLFWDIWNNVHKYKLPTQKNLTYMFEMFTSRNTIVVKPEREAILLHGARNNETFEEMDPQDIAAQHGWEAVPSFSFKNLEEVVAAANQLNPAQHEGFVVRDADFNRVKIKSVQYVALAHLNIKGKVSVNAKHMLQIVRTNESTEFLTYFPEHQALHKLVHEAYQKLVQKLEQATSIPKSETQLFQFAKKMKEDNVKDVKAYLQNYENLDQLLSLLNLNFVEETSSEMSAEDALKSRKAAKQKQKAEKREKKNAKKNKEPVQDANDE